MQNMQSPSETVYVEKLQKPDFAETRVGLLLTPTNSERLMLKENDELLTWAGGKPPEAAGTQLQLGQLSRRYRRTEAIVLKSHRPKAEDQTVNKGFAAPTGKPARTQRLRTIGATLTSGRSCDCSAPVKRVLRASRCGNSTYAGGMPKSHR